jgi:hypothetical protein
LTIVLLSVLLRFTDSAYPFGIFKQCLIIEKKLWIVSLIPLGHEIIVMKSSTGLL